MLYLIICSRTSDISSELKENINATIGCDYGLVVIDNSNNDYSIFSAYNEGVRRSKGDVLCFMHDDILFHTVGWGNLVNKHFENENLGLLGVIGSHVMMDMPLPWWSYFAGCGQIIQGVKTDELYVKRNQQYTKQEDETCEDAACVDGLWFCVRKSLFDKIRFDDVTYKGFHCYDCDICMQVINNGMQVRIANDVLIEHLSKGVLNDMFYENIKIWNNKWREKLPIVRGIELSDTELEERRYNAEYLLKLEDKYAELIKVSSSKEYRIGKTILKPWKIFKHIK